MAYNHKPPYGAPPRPRYDSQDPSHHDSFSNGGGKKRGHGTDNRYGNTRRHQHHQNACDPHEDYSGYNQHPLNEPQNGRYADDDGYGNFQSNWQKERPQIQHTRPRPSELQWGGSEDLRQGALPGGKPRWPANSAYSPWEEHQRSSDRSRSQEDRALYDTAHGYHGGPARNQDEDYAHEEVYQDPRPNPRIQHYDHQPQRHYGHPSSNKHDQSAPPNGRVRGAFYGTHYEANSSAQNDGGAAPKSSKPTKYGPAIEKGNGNGEPIPSRPKRMLGEAKSPETLAWNNPFPTFPTKPKQSSQTKSSSLHTSTARTSLDDSNLQHRAYGSRPQTARSKGSHNSSHHSVESVFERYSDDKTGFKAPEHVTLPASQQHGSTQQRLKSPIDTHNNMNLARERPRIWGNEHYGRSVEQLRASPTEQNRRSEDNRARPSIPLDNPPTSSYERSRTMPAAISGNVVYSGLVPTGDHSSWQEPGSIAGYFGPGDKDFLPIAQSNESQQRAQAPPSSASDESRWGKKNAVKTTPRVVPPQPHAAAESVGEIFDSYHEEPPKEYQPYEETNRQTRPPAADDELPDFDAMTETGGRRRGMTIDDHLEPQAKLRERAQPMPAHSDPYEPRNRYADNYTPNEMPRSKSQPDLHGRTPGAQQIQGFVFGVPAPPERRPATSAPPNNYGNNGRSLVTQPPGPWPAQNSRLMSHNGPRQMTGQEFRHHGQNRGTDPRKMAPGRMQPDRHRPPPMPNGRPPNDRMRHPGSRPTPDPTANTSPTAKPLLNPDALPRHPAPIRPGLANALQSSQATRPAPVRQYNGAPDPVQLPGTSRSTEGEHRSAPVTHQELETLRQKTLRSPSDQATQLLLAKKLVEASTVLVDEHERADPHTKKRNRDRYNSEALKITKKLSANNYPEADFYYADCFSRGALGLQSDIKEAFTLYQKAAKANHAQAAYRVAVCCEIGQEEGGGTKRDAVKAMQWYKRAATLGDVAAMYKMGVIQLKGLLGQPKDSGAAVTWLKRAAERADMENPHALHELALLHETSTSIEGVRKDEAQSLQLFTRAANLGYKFSQYRLGCAYEYGLLGCPVDPRQSIAWYSKAAVQEEHQSELALSGWYLTGWEGVLQQSDTEAYLWARKAAQAGLAKAEYAMGYFTEVGIGAPANLEDAKRWYWRSASQNFSKARDRLEDLRKGGAVKQKARVSRSNMKKQSDAYPWWTQRYVPASPSGLPQDGRDWEGDYDKSQAEGCPQKYPNVGSRAIAESVLASLRSQSINAQGVSRGLDHGVWASFKVAFDPDSNHLRVPIVQAFLYSSEDPYQYYALGRAVSSLRSEGIVIIVSGMAVHNLRDLRFAVGNPKPMPYASSFDEALKEAVESEPEAREESMAKLLKRGDARQPHPTFEHILPIFVGAGAAGRTRGRGYGR
ncbi:MAG: hypothetical protein Q9217_000220 [Psora testacea]